jgi:thiosulfate/3-mercaptopyruvate sulfurtransferase
MPLTAIRRTTYPVQQPDLSLRAYLRDALDFAGPTNGKALVNVRSPAEFKGEVIAPPGMAETAQRAGHISGAQNVPCSGGQR